MKKLFVLLLILFIIEYIESRQEKCIKNDVGHFYYYSFLYKNNEEYRPVSAVMLVNPEQKSRTQFIQNEYKNSAGTFKKRAAKNDRTEFLLIDISHHPFSQVSFDYNKNPIDFKILMPNGHLIKYVTKDVAYEADFVKVIEKNVIEYNKIPFSSVFTAPKIHSYNNILFLNDIIKSKPISLVLFSKENERFKNFAQISEFFDDMHFFHCQELSCYKFFRNNEGGITLYVNKQKPLKRFTFPKGYDHFMMMERIYGYTSKIHFRMNEFIVFLIFHKKTPALIIFLDEKTERIANEIEEIAKEINVRIFEYKEKNTSYLF